MNMNMSRPSMLWLYGLIGAFIIGYYVFGDVNDTPVSSDWTTVEQMVEKGEVEKILIVNRDQAQVFLKKEAIAQYRRDTVDERFRRLPETGVQLLFTIGSVDSFREDLKAAEQQSGQVVPVAYKNETNDWTNVLINLLPWVVIIGAWFFIMRSMSRGAGGGAGGGIMNVGKAKAQCSTRITPSASRSRMWPGWRRPRLRSWRSWISSRSPTNIRNWVPKSPRGRCS